MDPVNLLKIFGCIAAVYFVGLLIVNEITFSPHEREW
jgi:hypothetical protein